MVIVIIGILAAVVGPRFFDRKVFDERLYFEESLTAVRFAQKLALSSGCPIRARIDGGGYALSYASACAGIASGTQVRNPSGGDYAAGLPSGVSVQQALDVTFNSLGAATASGCGRSPLPPCSARFGGGFSLVVHLDTGFIEVRP